MNKTPKLHADEVDIDTSLVKRLLSTQFPQWADLPIEYVQSGGTQNAIYRLGTDMAVRLPRIKGAVKAVEKEHIWLPKLAPVLPLAIPTPLAKGKPGEGYPWNWSIYQWLDGESAVDTLSDLQQAAIDIGHFVKALHTIDATDGPPARRGRPLIVRDEETRAAIKSLERDIDGKTATEAWETSLAAPVWVGPPVWIHGDLHADNLLTRKDKISAVIDFGSSGTGDPASDMMFAWTVLSEKTRDVFRQIVNVDEATWTRGRGWALTFALVALPYYRVSNPVLASIARRTIDEVLADFS